MRDHEAMRRLDRLRDYQVDQLSNYNAERSRGLMHTPEWQATMAGYQAIWNAHR